MARVHDHEGLHETGTDELDAAPCDDWGGAVFDHCCGQAEPRCSRVYLPVPRWI